MAPRQLEGFLRLSLARSRCIPTTSDSEKISFNQINRSLTTASNTARWTLIPARKFPTMTS